MSWTRLSVTTMFLVIILVVSVFGGHFGYSVNGVPQGGLVEGQPGILGALSWGWNAIGFYFSMMTFQIDNVPVEVNIVFLVINIITLLMIVSLFLPGGGG